MEDQINSDLKAAMLGGDKTKAETLRGIKAAILNEAISQGVRDAGLGEEQIQKVLAKESKKRAEAAEMYVTGGSAERAAAETAEKAIIDAYLPDQLDESVVAAAVDEEIQKLGATSAADMGKVIGAVRGRLGAGADGAVIARLAKEKLSQ
jgi:uncharacterized protein